MRSADSRSRRWTGVDLRPGCYAFSRHERRTSLTASLGCWHAYPVGGSAVLTLAPGSSPWRLQSAHGGNPAYVTDGDGRAGMRRARSAVICAASCPSALTS